MGEFKETGCLNFGWEITHKPMIITILDHEGSGLSVHEWVSRPLNIVHICKSVQNI